MAVRTWLRTAQDACRGQYDCRQVEKQLLKELNVGKDIANNAVRCRRARLRVKRSDRRFGSAHGRCAEA
jgi:hypothetical protein